MPPIFVIMTVIPYFWLGLVLILFVGVKLHWLPYFFSYDFTLTPGFNWTFISNVLEHAVLPAFTLLVTTVGTWILTMRNTMITTLAEDYVRMARAKGLPGWKIMTDYAARNAILPAFTLLVTTIGTWILTMRNTMITTLAEDYVRMARAKGLPGWKIMTGYAARNAILPNLTGFAMSLGFVIGGAILIEEVFNYQGLGYLLLQAVNNDDYPLMQALFLLITVAVLVAILISDVATAILDPRTRGAR